MAYVKASPFLELIVLITLPVNCRNHKYSIPDHMQGKRLNAPLPSDSLSIREFWQ